MQLAVVGLGLIGTSVALAARRAWPDARLIGVDVPGALLHPTITSTFDAAGADLATLSAADIVIMATPVDVTIDLFPRVVAHMRPDALITDTGSTKRAVIAAAHEAGLPAFVGGHPMAGAVSSGPSEARSDLFDGRPWFVVGSHTGSVSRVSAFVERLGARAVVHDDDGSRHDALVAAISHLPQLVASALMVRAGEAAGEDGLRFSGAGLRDTTRLAGSNTSMWVGILETNGDAIAPLLRSLAADLQQLADHTGDREYVARLFAEASRLRDIIQPHE